MVQARFGWSASGSGLVLLGLVGQTVFSPIIGSLAERIGPRWPSVFGLLASGPLFIALGFCMQDDSVTSKVLFCLFIMGIGFCGVVVWIPHLMGTAIIAERSGSGQVYALMNVAYAAGMTAGPLWAGAVNDRWGWPVFCGSIGVVGAASGVAEFFAWRDWKDYKQSSASAESTDSV